MDEAKAEAVDEAEAEAGVVDPERASQAETHHVTEH